MEKKKPGFIVNPITGMSGRVGLKGSDSEEILKQAKELGTEPESPGRSVATQSKILTLRGNPLLVDTGDDEANKMLTGYIKVTTGLNERIMLRVAS